MARKVYISCHHGPDFERASQIRAMNVVEANEPCPDAEWRSLVRSGDRAVGAWIDGQMAGRTCVVVLIGAETAGRKWITHEIETGWARGLGVVGISVHNLADGRGRGSAKGADPFADIRLEGTGERLSSIVRSYDPPYATSMFVYNFIKAYLEEWVEEAIMIRKGSPLYRRLSARGIYG